VILRGCSAFHATAPSPLFARTDTHTRGPVAPEDVHARHGMLEWHINLERVDAEVVCATQYSNFTALWWYGTNTVYPDARRADVPSVLLCKRPRECDVLQLIGATTDLYVVVSGSRL